MSTGIQHCADGRLKKMLAHPLERTSHRGEGVGIKTQRLCCLLIFTPCEKAWVKPCVSRPLFSASFSGSSQSSLPIQLKRESGSSGGNISPEGDLSACELPLYAWISHCLTRWIEFPLVERTMDFRFNGWVMAILYAWCLITADWASEGAAPKMRWETKGWNQWPSLLTLWRWWSPGSKRSV